MPYRSRERSQLKTSQGFRWVKTEEYLGRPPVETVRVTDAKQYLQPYTYNLSYEKISDFYEVGQDARYLQDNPCDHVRISVASTPQHPTVVHTSHCSETMTGGMSRTTINYPDPWGIHVSDLVDLAPVVPGSVVGELAYQSMKHFIDDIKQQGSLLNFLYELRDFRKLLGPAKQLLRNIMDMFDKPGLTWEFAIKPFIDDLRKLLGSFRYVSERIRWLAQHDGQETVVNFTVDDVGWEWLPDPIIRTSGVFPIAEPFCVSKKVKFRAHARVKISAKYLTSLSRRIDAYMHAIGVGGIFQWLEAGYHAVPFSWLLDFFFKTKRLFDKLDSPLFGEMGSSPIEVVSCTHSWKSEFKFDFYGVVTDSPTCGSGGSTWTYRKITSATLKRYTRNLGLPIAATDLVSHHSAEQDLSMLSILMQILLPGIRPKRSRK